MTNHFQLFKELPPLEFIQKLMDFYGIHDFDENYKFTRVDLEKKNVISNLNDLRNDFDKYYLKCKTTRYLDNLTIKKSITILRQFLRVYGYKIVSKEKYSNKSKYLLYHIEKIDKNEDANLVVDFD